MFKVVWDTETGGVRLVNKVLPETLGVSPRPVFFEELDLLKLNELGWSYPHCKEPLLWACNKQYYYRGKLVFEVKGANLFNAPTVLLQPESENLTLQPVDVETMLKRCNDYMFLAESEAIQFIRDTYLQYANARHSVEKVKANQLDFEALAAKAEKSQKQKMAIVKQDCDSFDIMPLETAKEEGKKVYQTTKIDVFLASFSGGKDSQVVLDLCTRAIPPSDFEVIYSDTGYELPTSLALYEEVKAHYHKLFPELRFRTARNHESVLNYWDKIGTPSDTHRWCCSVMKTAPLYRLLKIEGTNKQARVLTFDGVRAEESTRRSNYERIGRGVKHNMVINARPILEWTTTEIFLYLFKYQLTINPAYRQGMTRVGCLICPFSSEWNEMIANENYQKKLNPFLQKIEDYAKRGGIKDVKEYIAEGGWKRRASGILVDRLPNITFKSAGLRISVQIENPTHHPLTFLQALGDFTYVKQNHSEKGEILFREKVYAYELIEKKKGLYVFTIENIYDAVLIGLLKRVLYKATFCINCEVCEIECPTGALAILPDVSIEKSKCIHCRKCLEFHDRGCIVANSISITLGNMTNNKQGNIDRYKNFGLREEWLEQYMAEKDGFWSSNHGLNKDYQIPALKCWLKDAEIIDDSNLLTDLGNVLIQNKSDFPTLIWEVIWINLTYNSFIAGWFAQNVKRDVLSSSKLLEEQIQEQFPIYKPKTIHNAVYQLQRTLKESPIGETLCQFEAKDKTMFCRNSYNDLSIEAMAYSIYKYAQTNNIQSLRVQDIYSDKIHGIATEFCIEKDYFEKGLRALNSLPNKVLVAELNMGLDNITLRDDLDPVSVLANLLG